MHGVRGGGLGPFGGGHAEHGAEKRTLTAATCPAAVDDDATWPEPVPATRARATAGSPAPRAAAASAAPQVTASEPLHRRAQRRRPSQRCQLRPARRLRSDKNLRKHARGGSKRLDAAAGHRINPFHYGTDCSLHFRRPAALKRIRESVSPVASPLDGSARRARSKWWETGGRERGCGEGARTPVPYVYAVAPRRFLASRSVHETIKITSPSAGCCSAA